MCPWDSLGQVSLAEFCEESLCAWVKQPGNTWTNVGYFLVALLIFRSNVVKERKFLRVFGVIAFLTGIGSTVYHGTGTHLGMILDYTAILLGPTYMFSVNLSRWQGISMRGVYCIFAAYSFVVLSTLLLVPTEALMIYMVVSVPCCVLELRLFFRDRAVIRYKYLLLGWLFAGVGIYLWRADFDGMWCASNAHILSPHGGWHLVTAASIYFYFHYFTQFNVGAGLETASTPRRTQ